MNGLPRLSRAVVERAEVQRRADLRAPTPRQLSLPERAVQFGTGALLRGLVDAIIDDANRAGHFDGRVVAIGSTGSGRDETLNSQDGLFTLVVEGIENGIPVREHRIIASVSRAISATDEWDAVMACAADPALEFIFSNTTEIGIVYNEADAAAPGARIPRSFPGKLTRFLQERGRACNHARDKGVIILPCELIDRNGDVLRDIVIRLADAWKLGPDFGQWVRESVRFCNTLVDRIVTGAPSDQHAARLSRDLGYADAMLTLCEPYRLLAIEGDDALRARLRFARGDMGAIVVASITEYRERKVRLLNGGHTALVSLALLAGCHTVREAVEHDVLGAFLRHALFSELVPALEVPGGASFANDVLDRFANPFLDHQLRDITLHGGTKMRVRLVPAILSHLRRTGRAPASLALGFAAYVVLLARDDARTDGAARQPDEIGDHLRARWLSKPADQPMLAFARSICLDADLWEADLDAVPGFSESVAEGMTELLREGAVATVQAHLAHVEQRSLFPAST